MPEEPKIDPMPRAADPATIPRDSVKKPKPRKEPTKLPPEFHEIVLGQRAIAEKYFWGLAIACITALIAFDLVILPFYWSNAAPAAIACINGALGGSGGLLAYISAKIFNVYQKV